MASGNDMLCTLRGGRGKEGRGRGEGGGEGRGRDKCIMLYHRAA